MFKMQEGNFMPFLKRKDVHHWESSNNGELFHQFCVLVLNLSALFKLQFDIDIKLGIQIPYFPHMGFLIYQVEGIKSHPKSQSILYIQLMFTYVGMKRLWGKSTVDDVEAINKIFTEERRVNGEIMAKVWGS